MRHWKLPVPEAVVSKLLVMLEMGYLKDIWKDVCGPLSEMVYLHASFSSNMQSGFEKGTLPKSIGKINFIL